MYDSGGISLKPSDESHAQMKNDMTGAAAVLASMTVLQELGCTTEVIGYLCCTDNMPSGTALKLGDVLTMRDGTTVEVLNTDAEGRLVMADGLALSVEDGVDAIVDIATLTGACLRTFGVDLAGSITAGLFLEEFVGGLPWAHIDIAGTAQLPAASTWRNKGATGFGTRLLAELAVNFRRAATHRTDSR